MSVFPSLSGAQCRAARALLDLTLIDLAALSGVGRATIERLERDERIPRTSTLQRLAEFFTSRGIRFVADIGVIGQPPPTA